MSVRLAQIQAEHIAAALSQLYPENKSDFEQNLQAFLKELRELDADIAQMLSSLQGKAILVSHPAFGYFCQDYGIIQLSIEMHGKDPLPQHITEILEQAKKHDVTSVIVEPQSNNKGAELIARKLRLPVHQIDPYAEHYTDNLRSFAKSLID
jgi:zinc transport system substrate-binding protein